MHNRLDTRLQFRAFHQSSITMKPVYKEPLVIFYEFLILKRFIVPRSINYNFFNLMFTQSVAIK